MLTWRSPAAQGGNSGNGSVVPIPCTRDNPQECGGDDHGGNDQFQALHCVAPGLLWIGQLCSAVIVSGLVDEVLAVLAIELLDQIQIAIHWNAPVSMCWSTVLAVLHPKCLYAWLLFELQ